jgi:hypothetical protein
MTNVRERYNPVPIAANGNYVVKGTHIAGFLPTVGGTLSVTGVASDGVTAVTFVNAVPVTAGIYIKLPCEFTVAGTVVQLAGGAAGTLFV